MYNFFALIDRMKYIKRWSLMKSTKEENVAEHTEQVAVFAHALAVINNKIFNEKADVSKTVLMALFHETSEVITGDLPTPIKYFNSEITQAYKSLEDRANFKILDMLPDELKGEYTPLLCVDKNSIEYKLVKGADKLSAYVKCLEELKSGNLEFKKAKETIERDLKAKNMPEINYFLDKFIKGFTLTLDELDINID